MNKKWMNNKNEKLFFLLFNKKNNKKWMNKK